MPMYICYQFIEDLDGKTMKHWGKQATPWAVTATHIILLPLLACSGAAKETQYSTKQGGKVLVPCLSPTDMRFVGTYSEGLCNRVQGICQHHNFHVNPTGCLMHNHQRGSGSRLTKSTDQRASCGQLGQNMF